MPRSTRQVTEFDEFLARYRACLVVLSGRATGMEFVLDQGEIRLGRGPGVDLAIDDPSMEREHALLEFQNGCFCLRGVSSDASIRLNGGEVQDRELKNDDRFSLGEVSFEYSVAPRH